MRDIQMLGAKMIDATARKEAAETARHFASGIITNFEFENNFPDTEDPAVLAVIDTFWCLYDDFKEHKINDRWEIPKEFKNMMARWVMFLYSNEEYVWPEISHPGLRPFKYGFWGKLFNKHLLQQTFLNAGDYSVWPFISRESYENANNNPRLLNGS